MGFQTPNLSFLDPLFVNENLKMKMFKVFYYKYDISLKNIVVSKETIVDI